MLKRHLKRIIHLFFHIIKIDGNEKEIIMNTNALIILWTLRGSFQIRQKDEWLYRKYGDAGDKQSLTDRSGSQQTEPDL